MVGRDKNRRWFTEMVRNTEMQTTEDQQVVGMITKNRRVTMYEGQAELKKKSLNVSRENTRSVIIMTWTDKAR